MNLFAVIVLMVSFAVPVESACRPKCHKAPAHCKCDTPAKPCTTVVTVAPCPPCPPPPVPPVLSTWDHLVQGFEVQAGFRWQTETPEAVCPTPKQPNPPAPPTTVKDPFYLGVGTSLPLGKNVKWHGEWNRDFVDGPQWQARTWLAVSPWKK